MTKSGCIFPRPAETVHSETSRQRRSLHPTVEAFQVCRSRATAPCQRKITTGTLHERIISVVVEPRKRLRRREWL